MSGLRYSDDAQQKVNEKIEAGVSASTAEASAILREIHTAAFDLNEKDWRRQARIVAMFATLTVSLSIKADKAQKWMTYLTVSIAVMTLVLIGLTLAMLREMP